MQCTFGRSCNISNVNNMQEIRIFAQIFNRLLSKKAMHWMSRKIWIK